MRRAILLVALLGCSGGAPNAASEPDLVLCVSEVNRYRAMVGKPALARSTELELFAADGARIDGQSRVPHMHLRSAGDAGVGVVENEFPFQSFSGSGTIANLIKDTTAQVYSENEISEYKKNLLGPYTMLGCGVFREGDEVTLTEDFR